MVAVKFIIARIKYHSRLLFVVRGCCLIVFGEDSGKKYDLSTGLGIGVREWEPHGTDDLTIDNARRG